MPSAFARPDNRRRRQNGAMVGKKGAGWSNPALFFKIIVGGEPTCPTEKLIGK